MEYFDSILAYLWLVLISLTDCFCSRRSHVVLSPGVHILFCHICLDQPLSLEYSLVYVFVRSYWSLNADTVQPWFLYFEIGDYLSKIISDKITFSNLYSISHKIDKNNFQLTKQLIFHCFCKTPKLIRYGLIYGRK